MARALELAESGLGRVWPNPSVGCVLVRQEAIVGEGKTQPGGRPHAEVVALGQAGAQAKGATAYVSLEPCAHYGKTPPCATALIQAGIARCVVAIIDPDSRVNGRGLAMLEAARIQVTLGVLADRAQELNQGFFLRVQAGRPLVNVGTSDGHDAELQLDESGTGVWATVRGTGVQPVQWWIGAEPPVGIRPWRKFSAPLLSSGPSPADVLGQLGAQGLTRVAIAPDDPWVALLEANSLVDRRNGCLQTRRRPTESNLDDKVS